MKILISSTVLVLLVLLTPKHAEARRGIAIINTGENVSHVADVKSDLVADVESQTAAGVKVGILYSRFGVFWLDLWRWNMRFVLFSGDDVWEVPEADLKELAEGELKAPITMTLPPGLIAVVILGIGFGALTVFGSKEEEELQEDNADASRPGSDDEPPAV